MVDNAFSRGKIINNYLLTMQILFNFIVLAILFKYYDFGFYEFKPQKPFIFTLLIFLLLISIIYVFRHKKNLWLDVSVVLLDLILINILIFKTNLYEVRFLYLIPLLTVAIKHQVIISSSLAVLIGIYNIFFNVYKLNNQPMQYTLETDLILFSIFLMLIWLIGSYANLERRVREKLYRTNESLIQNKTILETIVYNLPLALVAIDKNETIVLINQPALEISPMNIKAEELIGTNYKFYFTKMFENVSYKDSRLLETLYHGKSVFNEKIIRNNRILQLTRQPIYNSAGKIKYALAIFQDITAEEIMNEKMRNLENLNTIGQMAATIAHEIKNPLTTIKGFLQLGLKSQDHLKEPQLELLISEIDRCNAIIKDFLSTKKNSHTVKEKCNLKRLIENHIPLIDKDATYNEIKLNLELNEVSDLMLNSSEIKQLLLNFSRNAIEAMEEGGCLIIRVWEKEDDVILEVEDQGPGIPQEVLEKIGTPFVTTKEKGTGLGITVCQRIAENHGARIIFDSQEGVGTKVKVIFPKI